MIGHYIELPLPENRTLKVNPLQVGGVCGNPDKPAKSIVIVSGVEKHVLGSEAEILALLGWTPLKVPPPVAAGEPEPKTLLTGKTAR